MDGGQKVWVPDIEHGFRLGTIIDLGADEITVEVDGLKGKVGLYLMNKLPQKLSKPPLKSRKLIFLVRFYCISRLSLHHTTVCSRQRRIIRKMWRIIVSLNKFFVAVFNLQIIF